jgi:hypothetical protein
MSIDPSTMADCEEQEDGSNEQEDVNIGKAHDDAANASGSCANTDSPDMESEEEESASNVEKPGEEESERGGVQILTLVMWRNLVKRNQRRRRRRILHIMDRQ